MTIVKFVLCAKCGKEDRTIGPYEARRKGLDMRVGTATVMKCPDCSGVDGFATMCRGCCPTGHGTRWEEV